jgi:hypothetical protein
VLPEFVEGLGLALGGHYREQDLAIGNNNGHDLYFVASYRVGFLMPSLGFRYESITGANDESEFRVFGSLVADILPNLAVAAEVESASSKLEGAGAKAPFWFGVRYQPIETLSLQAGLMNMSDIGAGKAGYNDLILHIGAQYAFSFSR